MNYREELKNILMRVRGDTIAFGVYMGAEDEALEEAAKQLLVEFGKSLNKAEKLIQEAKAEAWGDGYDKGWTARAGYQDNHHYGELANPHLQATPSKPLEELARERANKKHPSR